MSRNLLRAFAPAAILSMHCLIAPPASAVGNGVPFVFTEGAVPGALVHTVSANSLDFTYRTCVNSVDADTDVESGYFWLSSFQRPGRVVDSQINYFLPNGYHLYAIYRLREELCSEQQTCTGARRRNFFVPEGSIVLFLDPLQDTLLTQPSCGVGVSGNADDVVLGSASFVESGQKSETGDQANGDFDVVFRGWTFTPTGMTLFHDPTGSPLPATRLVFNGNITLLGATLGTQLHRAEGSGNIFWRQ